MQLAHPFRVDGRGRSAQATEEDHVRDLIELVLFTAPGERVMRPAFGAGVRRMVFAPLGPEGAAAARFVIEGALQTHLGHRIAVEAVEVEAEDATLTIRVAWRLLATGAPGSAAFAAAVGP